MRKTKMKIWGREFKLEVIYDVYKGESVLPEQRQALEKFVESDEAVKASLDAVKKHCLKDDNMQDVNTIDNIFKYVIPTSIFNLQLQMG
mgnify:FL=1